MRTHHLEIWPEYFLPVTTGDKTFELRRDDRGFAVGDVLVLEEFDPATKSHTGRRCCARVTYIKHGGTIGLADDHVIMAIDIHLVPSGIPSCV